MIDGLEIANMSATLTTEEVPIEFDYENTNIFDMTFDTIDSLIRDSNHKGQAARDNYQDNVVDVADFDHVQARLFHNLNSSFEAEE